MRLLARAVRPPLRGPQRSWLAITWHVLLLAALLWWRARAPLHELVVPALLLALPLSVGSAAAAFENPFNAVSFGVLTGALGVAVGMGRAPAGTERWAHGRTEGWAPWLAGALLWYGWCYPHFVAAPWYSSLYAAPLGVLPCPTLATLAGLTLAAPAGSRAIPALLALWTAFYALFGILELGVYLDAGLLVASVALSVRAFARQQGGRTAPAVERVAAIPGQVLSARRASGVGAASRGGPHPGAAPHPPGAASV